MVKLKNIKKNGTFMECDILPEDSKDFGHVAIDLRSKDPYKTVEYTLPEGYEDCLNHVSHTVTALLKMKDLDEIPSERLVMWY